MNHALTAALAMVLAAACAEGPEHAVPANVVFDTRVGPVKGELRITEVTLPADKRRDARALLAVVREPSSGLHWWCVIDGPPTRPPSESSVRRIIQRSRFVVDGTSIIGFWPNDIWLNARRVSAHSPSLGAALAETLASPELGAVRAGGARQWKNVPVGLALPRSFVRPSSRGTIESSEVRAVHLAIGEISLQDGRAYVTLKNEQGSRKQVILSDL